jgi:hypothetical protein
VFKKNSGSALILGEKTSYGLKKKEKNNGEKINRKKKVLRDNLGAFARIVLCAD